MSFITKLHVDAIIARHKARLIALGNNQEFGLNYFDTFSTVAKFTTLGVLLTVATTNQWSILQLDISNAFLHDKLNDMDYMKQPPRFKDPIRLDYVSEINLWPFAVLTTVIFNIYYLLSSARTSSQFCRSVVLPLSPGVDNYLYPPLC